MLRELNAISRESSVEKIYHCVACAMLRLLPVEHAAVLLVEDNNNDAAHGSSSGSGSMLRVVSRDGEPVAVPTTSRIAGDVVASHKMLRVQDSVLALPVFSQGGESVVAVLEVLNKHDGGGGSGRGWGRGAGGRARPVDFDDADGMLLEV